MKIGVFLWRGIFRVEEVLDFLGKMWQEKNDFLEKIFEFADFPSALAWMVQCGFAIEAMQHHPERRNVYNKVFVKLTTHDAGNRVTEKDRALAAKMDEIFVKFSG